MCWAFHGMNELRTGAEQVCPAPAEKNEVTAVAEFIKKAVLGPPSCLQLPLDRPKHAQHR
ncbi:MAG: hypothetical protein CME32_19490 [Gimesia sp.]|nr:hypothetical protein [Gimesia sp.]